jgi:hypothetical protein
MSKFLKYDDFLNESKDSDVVAVAITKSGKEEYTRGDIQEFLDEPKMYWSADNLPKWLFLSNYAGPSDKTPKRQAAVTILLKYVQSGVADKSKLPEALPPA